MCTSRVYNISSPSIGRIKIISCEFSGTQWTVGNYKYIHISENFFLFFSHSIRLSPDVNPIPPQSIMFCVTVVFYIATFNRRNTHPVVVSTCDMGVCQYLISENSDATMIFLTYRVHVDRSKTAYDRLSIFGDTILATKMSFVTLKSRGTKNKVRRLYTFEKDWSHGN